jgi:hypothetical protein
MATALHLSPFDTSTRRSDNRVPWIFTSAHSNPDDGNLAGAIAASSDKLWERY